MIYLDNNATTDILPQSLAAASNAMLVTGNPSSVHEAGRAAKRLIEDARLDIANLLGARANQVIFTSGATEANNLVMTSFVKSHRLLVSAIEHDSILKSPFDIEIIPVSKTGIVDLVALENMLKEPNDRPVLLSIMGVNNETGVIQPHNRIKLIAKKYKVIYHCDAVQMADKIKINFNDDGYDMLSISAHKIGGMRGVGALIVNRSLQLKPMICGGGQEKGDRAGTENVVGIAAFGAAARAAAAGFSRWQIYQEIRNEMEMCLCKNIAGAMIIGVDAPRVATTCNISVPNIAAATQVMAMDLEGFAISAGSACSSGKVKSSHVIAAMGYGNDVASSAIRISLGWNVNASDVDKFIAAYIKFINNHKS